MMLLLLVVRMGGWFFVVVAVAVAVRVQRWHHDSCEDSSEKTAGRRKLTTVDRLCQLIMLNGRQWIQLH